ncbi:ankyrin repeat domain-containing protein [Undibacterium pigrum]|uniref:Ankyrin repeat protein n=1 Tax=Undibacterium pigrum TaxID=401470 RepID=A0A318J0T7_9BURK|nr:ankyrin repeat domain-containing protein [Undibacterium pigrum]PXX40310.1 ankyrin repeat protein [Undibacterium pigrum]
MSHNLIKAASEGKFDKLVTRLEQGDEIESIHKGTGRSALAEAALNGHADIVHHLLTLTAKFDEPDKAMSYTPFLWACAQGHLPVARLLAEHGANVGFSSKPHGWTALMVAAANGHAEVVQFLLGLGVEPGTLSSDGRNAYSMAVKNRRQHIADILAQAGATTPEPPAAPVYLPWPASIGDAGVDSSNAASVLQHFILAMHQWEKDAASKHVKIIEGSKVHDWPAMQAEMAAIFERYCTPKERPYGRNGGSFSTPPAYQPAESLLSMTDISKQKKELQTRYLDREFSYIAILKKGEWRLDSKRQRLVGSDWIRDNL